MANPDKETECALDECEITFEKKVHNQRFCSRECCRIYTNARILASYHEKKNRVKTGRVCKDKSCSTLLSRYNEGDYCSIHEKEQFISKIQGWGWDCDSDGNIRF